MTKQSKEIMDALGNINPVESKSDQKSAYDYYEGKIVSEEKVVIDGDIKVMTPVKYIDVDIKVGNKETDKEMSKSLKFFLSCFRN
jgi:hypothetical protein